MIKPLLTNPLTYEVDPARLDETESIETNRKNLIALTGKVFDAIVDSAEMFPPQLRSMCHCLYQVSETETFSRLMKIYVFLLLQIVGS